MCFHLVHRDDFASNSKDLPNYTLSTASQTNHPHLRNLAYAACPRLPTAVISAPSDPCYICVGCSIDCNGANSYDNDEGGSSIEEYKWDFADGSDPCTAACPSHTYNTVGIYIVTLEVADDEETDPNDTETCTVYVVEVNNIVEYGTTNEGPLYVCLDDVAYVEAIPNPAGVSFPSGEPNWTVSQPAGADANWVTYDGGAALALYNITVAGTYTVKATCGACDCGDSNTVIAEGWEADPNISGAAIKKSHDQVWFHISQTCDLRAKGYDADTKCGTQYDDYIRLDLTTWSGSPYLLSTLGEQVQWKPTAPTSASGHTISATIKDDPNVPDESNTDDGDASASRVLKAYEAVADLVVNWANSGGFGDDTTTLYETTGALTDSISRNMNDSESVSVDATTLPINTTGTDSSFFEPQQPFVKGKWTLKLNPSTAPLDPPGKIKVTTDVEVSGTLECTVDDEDVDWSGCPVSVSVSATMAPVGVSISCDLDTSGDTCEALAAISWGYSSDLGLSRESPQSEELEKSSGDGTGTFQQTFSYAPFSQNHIGEKGETAEGFAKVGGRIEAKGYHEAVWLPPGGWVHDYFDSSASMACIGSSVTYYIELPMVQNPAYWPAEEGY